MSPVATGVMPLWSSCSASAGGAGLWRGLFPARCPWRTAVVWRSGRSSTSNKLAGPLYLRAAAGFSPSSCRRGDGRDASELHSMKIQRGVSSIWSRWHWIRCRCNKLLWSSSTAVFGVSSSAQPQYLLAERRPFGVPASIHQASFWRRLFFYLQAMGPIRRQGIYNKASAPSSSRWWRRRGERFGPSGIVPGIGALGSSLKTHIWERRATLQPSFTF